MLHDSTPFLPAIRTDIVDAIGLTGESWVIQVNGWIDSLEAALRRLF